MRKYLLLLFLISIPLADESKSRGIVDDYTKLKNKIYTGTRTGSAPIIDGKLDDEVWGNAILLDDFLQFEIEIHMFRDKLLWCSGGYLGC